ncbi:coenzyme F420-0:L-glutamate ligase [Pseudoflavonifractor sp. DSM 107456]|uniref:Coenzyme F420-0:L-glutamate ligase n=2 Tax=Pseudoflavonifractor TaxID=1017280 RepID=A0ABR9RBB7_9FIRM|nr:MULTISPECIES: coenzyme F420-0:L-glutamate ligase [Eubacteriales]MBC5729399.1 coenzyme F420-0:L-glutamate ligase [Pseudoflavonifractor hominis]MBE5055989.1 coenzyme F420-0:L-glutamate ligase [Pseudoflavonifractor gallinarum]MBS5136612.1 coenzyme F420-0:L-glutamate ligase [Oscillospiraceae bacterium]MBT9684569.1 F420-0--gamma-glutamyl ligase [Pseudoflavonifractor sp. MCC625]
MSRMVGTISRGVRAPIIRSGDDLSQIVPASVLEAAAEDGFSVRDRDIIAMTEAIVARAQGNYASVDHIAADVRAKLGGETIGVIFPILSRNRFAICLRGIAKGAKKVVLMLSYPSDEVGNHLIDVDVMDEKGIDPYQDVLTLERYRELFGYTTHPFTGVDYVAYYADLIRESGAEVEIIFANDPRAILKYTKNVLACDIHTRKRTKRLLKAAGAERVFGLDDILTAPVDGSGYNEKYGLLGSNKSTEETVKLFPRECQDLVESIQKIMLEKTGKHVEVMVYGDGAFKDPVGKIWELADPVVSPAYTAGLEGTPNELKLKYLADNDFADLSGEALRDAIKAEIQKKDGSLVGKMVSEGTTPRRLTDLIGSLCDLTSGSGDKGTPIVYIQGYFDNYTTE